MKSEHLDPNIGLSIKNKSGKWKLSHGGGLKSKPPSNPCVFSLDVINLIQLQRVDTESVVYFYYYMIREDENRKKIFQYN